MHFVHHQTAPEWGVTIAARDAAIWRPEDLYAVAAEGYSSVTREEGVQRLFRTEPRASPVQSFRFRIAAHSSDAAPAPESSFFGVSDPGVQLLAFKPAEFRPGWHVLRFQENSGKGARGVKLVTPFRVLETVHANLVEEPENRAADLSNLSLDPWQTLTVLVRLASPDRDGR